MNAKDIFDTAIGMKPGEIMEVECYTLPHLESVRTALAAQRKKFVEETVQPFDILINRRTTEGKYVLYLQKIPRITSVTIHSQEGTRQVNLDQPEPDEELPLVSDEDDKERMAKLMKEDGKSEEEIQRALGKE